MLAVHPSAAPVSLRIVGRAPRLLGSLQLALILLPCFALALGLGTWVESALDSKSAHQLVYHTWWFQSLLALLALNIFCAALKKWPWRRHQAGFLITHLGLLTLLAGAVLTSMGAARGAMTLIDTEDPRFRSFGLPATNSIVDPQRELIRVRRPGLHAGRILYRTFEPGPVAWHSSRTPEQSWATCLDALAHPWPRSWAMALDTDARLEVLDYHPHALVQPFRAAAESEHAFPALAIELSSATTGVLGPHWLAFHDSGRTLRLGPALVEVVGRHSRPEQDAEFQRPPADAGREGTLVIGMAGATLRLDVARERGREPQPLGATGWSVRLLEYLPNYRQPGSQSATDPGLSLELSGPRGKVRLACAARQPGELFPMGRTPVPADALPGLWGWYHGPDPAYGDRSVKGVLQLLPHSDGTIQYRTYVAGASLQLEKCGSTAAGMPRERIWTAMGWGFRVTGCLARAAVGPQLVPVARRVGQDDGATTPMIRCRLSHGTSAVEFSLGKSDGEFTPVHVGGADFLVGYHAARTELDFAVRLERAEQTTESGSELPTAQTSFVLLTDPARRLQNEPRTIALNQPLVHDGYRLYQAGYRFLGKDSQGKPVSCSILAVQRDPGLWLKYAGSTMVALGIACMFYMRAYFFKRS